jgi:hypothetical protein
MSFFNNPIESSVHRVMQDVHAENSGRGTVSGLEGRVAEGKTRDQHTEHQEWLGTGLVFHIIF